VGKLTVICGPMYSGKSEELMRLLRRSEIGGKSTILLRPDFDDRYDKEKLVSHAGAVYRSFSVAPIAPKIWANGQFFDVVGIDEVQFFNRTDDGTTVEEVIGWLVDRGKDVIVSGLDMTYRREPFGCVPNLMAMADTVIKLDAVCHKCGGTATLTQRLIDDQPAPFTGPTVQVGGLDTYEARCKECWEKG